ncbi:MAG: hypothetical protein JWN36_3237, partial [Microbacteriaceae bacterium]|nr:hypothetical protein [Microbacteriaceae bacterium]
MTALTDTPAAPEPVPMAPVPARPPRRWLGPNGGWWLLLIGGVILAGYLTYDALVVPHVYTRSIPTESIVLGSFLAVVCVFYTMLYRLRTDDGVTIARLFAALGAAGLLTTFAAAQANGAIARLGIGAQAHLGDRSVGIVSGLFAGPVEETLKGLTVLLVGLTLATKTFRGGLFVGGAVGLGFAAFENLEYLASGWSSPILTAGQVGSLTLLTVGRTIITPLLHPILTSLLGGALFATSR